MDRLNLWRIEDFSNWSFSLLKDKTRARQWGQWFFFTLGYYIFFLHRWFFESLFHSSTIQDQSNWAQWQFSDCDEKSSSNTDDFEIVFDSHSQFFDVQFPISTLSPLQNLLTLKNLLSRCFDVFPNPLTNLFKLLITFVNSFTRNFSR